MKSSISHIFFNFQTFYLFAMEHLDVHFHYNEFFRIIIIVIIIIIIIITIIIIIIIIITFVIVILIIIIIVAEGLNTHFLRYKSCWSKFDLDVL